MGLFRRKPEFDAELDSRVDRLESECRQARLHCESLPDGADKQKRMKDLEVAEQAVAEARAEGDKAARIRAALRAEAELCLTKPVPLLVPTANACAKSSTGWTPSGARLGRSTSIGWPAIPEMATLLTSKQSRSFGFA